MSRTETLICVLFRDTPAAPVDVLAAKPMSRDERCLILLIGATSVLWFTDFLHGVSPAWVGLAAAGMCLMPGIGPARTASFSEGISFSTWFLLAAVVGLGAVIDHTGLGMAIGQGLAGLLDLAPGEPARNFASLIGIGMAVSGTATIVGAPAIMTALAEPLAAATGLPIETVLLAQVPSWAFFIFPYQMPILLIGMGIARVPFGQATRLLVAMTGFGMIVVLPLHFLWLQALGYFG